MSMKTVDVIGTSDQPPFFKIANADAMGLGAPAVRLGYALRTWVHHISGFQKEAVVTSARTGDTWRLVSDEGAYLNGFDAAPAPLPFLTTGMIAAYANEITALAEQQNITIRGLKLIQDNYYTMRASMPKRTMTGGALPVDLVVEIDCDLSDTALNEFLMNAIHASPLNGLMRGARHSLFKLEKAGRELTPSKVGALDAPLLTDPGEKFAAAEPVPGDDALLTRLGLTPEKPVKDGTNTANVGLADEQSRVLNIRAECSVRPDGIKEITTLLYSPHGTSFRLLSEEARVNGGQGRAPDANTYISAGIGLCFMTQLGRFATVAKLALEDYRIIQDTHFSLGGASGGTGRAGTADPVETHVFLETDEPDDAARDMLDMSEQTCFLHAFCRTDLKTKLKVVRN